MSNDKLTTFMFENYRFKEKSIVRRSKLVVEGDSLCSQLYKAFIENPLERNNYSIGRDYSRFYTRVCTYFRQLYDRDIETYVVLSGADFDNKKLLSKQAADAQTEQIRAISDSASPIVDPTPSCLMKTVFLDALHSSRGTHLHTFIANGDATRVIALLARKLDSYVVGKNSEFFFYNIKGYIPLCDKDGKMIDLADDVKYYNYQSFCDLWYIKPQARFFLPYCLGSDSHGRNPVPSLKITSTATVEDIMTKIQDAKFEYYSGLLKEERRKYDDIEGELDESESRYLGECPDWIVANFKAGNFPAAFINMLVNEERYWPYSVVVEDMSRPSAWRVTRSMFLYIASILTDAGDGPVIKFDRRQLSVHHFKIRLLDKHKTILLGYNLESITEMSLEDRRKIFIRVFHCKSVVKALSVLPEKYTLVAIATRCWLKKVTQIPQNSSLVKSLATAFILCFKTATNSSVAPFLEMRTPIEITKEARHLLAQWECIMYFTIAFNQLLNNPYTYQSLGLLYNETTLRKLLTFRDFQPVLDKLNRKDQLEFYTLLNTVTRGLL